MAVRITSWTDKWSGEHARAASRARTPLPKLPAPEPNRPEPLASSAMGYLPMTLNLNTYKPAALHQAFEPAMACPLIERLEIHHTPKHGKWLNMAEIELAQ